VGALRLRKLLEGGGRKGRARAKGGLGVSTHRDLVPYRWNIFHTSSSTVITAIRSIPFHTQIWDLFNNFLHHFLQKSTVKAKPNRHSLRN